MLENVILLCCTDYTNNRVANKNPDGSGVVSLMADLKEYEVNSTGYCQSYCPIPKNEAGLYPFALPNGTTDIGPTTVSPLTRSFRLIV